MKLYLILTLLLSPLSGQEQNPNRFKKPTLESELLETVVRTLTLLEITQSTLQSWQQEHPGEPLSRNQVQKWQERGKARFINQSMINGLVTLEENVEHSQQVIRGFIFPDEYSLTQYENERPMPNNFISRDLGVAWSISFDPSQDGKISDRLQASYGAYLGNRFSPPFLEKNHHPGDVGIPIFRHSVFDEEVSPDQVDHTTSPLVDLLSPPDNAIVLFSDVQKIKMPVIKMNPKLNDKSLTISASYIKLPDSDWRAFSKGRQLDDIIIKSANWAAKLVSQKQASLLYSPSIMLSLKQNGTTENIDQVIYPTEYVPSDLPERLSRTNTPTPAAFDTKNIGFSLELEPELHSSGYLLLRYSSYLAGYHGKAVSHRYFDGQEWVADVWMPRFSHMSQRGRVALIPGENTLVGVSASIDEKGNPDPENRLLFFLKAE